MTDTAQTLLTVEDLSVRIGQGATGIVAVDGVSFDVRQGEVLGIVGESGSGKSVTLRTILGLGDRNRKVSGAIHWQGSDLLGMSKRHVRALRGREIGVVFQDAMTALNPVATVGAQIQDTLKRHTQMTASARRERVLELLRLVGIADAEARANDYPHQFSGGMRQRVMIAIALAAEPKLLLADEPTTALDVTVQDQILRLLLRLRDELGMSVVLVTHDLGVVAETCDRVAVMYAGRIVECGPVDEIFRRPRHAYTLALLNSIPAGGRSARKLNSIAGMLPKGVNRAPGCIFAPRCSHATAMCHSLSTPLVAIDDGHKTACLHHSVLPMPHAPS